MEKSPQEKPEEKSKGGKLEEFSELLIRLGKEIERDLEEKAQLEEQIRLQRGEIMKTEKGIFTARTRLAELSVELGGLEAKRKEFEEKKLLLEEE